MSINKNYKTSVRRACRTLVTLGERREYTASYDLDELINDSVKEVTDWIVAQAKKGKQ